MMMSLVTLKSKLSEVAEEGVEERGSGRARGSGAAMGGGAGRSFCALLVAVRGAAVGQRS